MLIRNKPKFKPTSKVADQIFTLRPPFPWNCIGDAQLELSDCIEKTESRLRTVYTFADRSVETWDIQQIPWFPTLIDPANSATIPFPDIETGDSESRLDHDLFIDWLVEAISSPPTSQEIANFLEKHRELIRNKPVFSFQETGMIDLRYYPHEIIREELSELILTVNLQTHISPLVLVAGIFAHFIAIHPFMDGNGRAARRLMLGLLRKLGLWGEAPLPFPFLLYRDRVRHVKSTRVLLIKGSANQYLQHMMSILGAAAELSVLLRYFHPQNQMPRTEGAAS